MLSINFAPDRPVGREPLPVYFRTCARSINKVLTLCDFRFSAVFRAAVLPRQPRRGLSLLPLIGAAASPPDWSYSGNNPFTFRSFMQFAQSKFVYIVHFDGCPVKFVWQFLVLRRNLRRAIIPASSEEHSGRPIRTAARGNAALPDWDCAQPKAGPAPWAKIHRAPHCGTHDLRRYLQ